MKKTEMATSLKTLMGMSEKELQTLGLQYGLNFQSGIKKSEMAKQIEKQAAAGWMEVNKELMEGKKDEEHSSEEHSAIMFEGDTLISDSARVADIISKAGFTETFHEVMNGPAHKTEAVHEYLHDLGVNADDVWKHMPKPNPNEVPKHWGAFNEYMRDTLTKHQDIMPELPGHHAGNIMDEYSTNKGGIHKSYEYLSHMYIDRSQYNSKDKYEHDLNLVSTRLQNELGSRFKEVAFSSAIGAKSSYIDALPRIGEPTVVKGVEHPRAPLNVSGLPYGSYGAGINPEYSLSASLSGSPGWSEVSKSLYADISEATKSLAKVYSGGVAGDESYRKKKAAKEYGLGMSWRKHETSDRDSILDSASRYTDIVDARNGYENLKRDVGDEPRYSGAAIRAVLENAHDYNEAETQTTFDPVDRIRRQLADTREPSVAGAFTTEFGPPTSHNAAFERREAKAIAQLDASYANFRDVSDYGTGRNTDNPIKFHNMEQGTQEWLDFRSQFDITGSTVGKYLGHAPRENSSPIKAMGEHIGLTKKTDNEYQKKLFERGHRLEAVARPRVAEQFGFEIKQTGAITNSEYPGMLYSPDGLIEDDAIWEHKAPNKFNNLADTPEYIDQMQLGMLLSGRNRALFSQTVGDETRSEWIERDPEWYERNKLKLESTRGRLAAGREFMANNSPDSEEYVSRGRAAMTGEGIWGFQSVLKGGEYTAGKRGMSRYSPNAGTEADPFVRSGEGRFQRSENEFEDNGYRPNFTFGSRTQIPPELLQIGYNPSASSGETVNGGAKSEVVLAEAVKTGILAAQEENRNRSTQNVFDGESSRVNEPDADFLEDFGERKRITGGAGGGGKKPPKDKDWFTGGTAGGDIVRGMAGGSVNSMMGGGMSALMRTPWGMVAAAGIGAVMAGNELGELANESLGTAQDAGMTNPIGFASQTQGMEMLGLSERQAGSVAQTTHSAYNTMLNGDPSGAVRIVQGTRGLVTIGDIRAAEGDPVALARVIQERGRERGWSQARIAGAMEMAGLNGMARAYDRPQAQARAEAVRDAGASADTSEAVTGTEALQTVRRQASPEYAVQSEYFQSGGGIARNAAQAAQAGLTTATAAREGVRNFYDWVSNEESGGRETGPDGQLLQGINPATGKPSGAKGSMQVTDSTMRDPGLPGIKGIDPKTATPEQRAQFGRDYLDALTRYYKGDMNKVNAAYTDGFGTVDKAVREKGEQWLTAVPAQAQKRVEKYQKWLNSLNTTKEGADGFTRNGVQYGQTPTTVNIKLEAKVNNQTATATVAAPNGQTSTQTINMNNGAQQRR